MSTIFPLKESVSLDSREPRLVDLDDDVADEVFEALSSATTREIFNELHESPQTATDLADVTDTSIQNIQYHLEKLVDADLVEVVDTWYSERGTEMKVYAPTDESLVLFAGGDKQSSLRALLRKIVGILAVLLPASGVTAFLARQFDPADNPVSGSGAPSAAPAVGDVGSTPTATATPARTPGGEGDAPSAIGIEQGGTDTAVQTRTATTSGGDGGGVGAMDVGDSGAETATAGGDGGDGGGLGTMDVGDGGTASTATPQPTPTGDGATTSFEARTADTATVKTDGGQNVTLSDAPGGTTESVETATPTPDATPTPEQVANATETLTPDGLADAAVDAAASSGIDPALLAGGAFFLGGLFVLTLVALTRYPQA